MTNHQQEELTAEKILSYAPRIRELLDADITTLNKEEILIRLHTQSGMTRGIIDLGLKAIQNEAEDNNGKLNVSQIKRLAAFIKSDIGLMTDDIKKVMAIGGELPEDAEKLVDQIDVALQILPVMIFAAEQRNKQIEQEEAE